VGTKRNWLLALSLAVALCASCGKPQNGAPGPVSPQVGAQKPATTDAQILADLKKTFAEDPDLKKEKIEITVQDRRVTLTGTVSSSEIRIKAEDKARAHPDVFGVNAEKLLAQ
jgi:hypothetical protein